MSDSGSTRGASRGSSSRNRRSGGSAGKTASTARKSAWTSDHPTLKSYTFTEGTAESAAQFVESLRKYIEYTRSTDTIKEADLIAEAIEREVIPIVPAPRKPPQIEDPDHEGVMIDDDAEIAIWQENIKMVARKRDALKEGLKRQYAVLKGQCTPTVMGRLKGEEGWDLLELEKDPIKLVQRIRRVCCGFETHKQPMYALGQAERMLYTYIQRGETNEKYKEGFEAICHIIEQFGGTVASHPHIAQRRAIAIAAANGRDEVTEQDMKTATDQVTEEMKAVLLIGGANEKRYGALKNHLHNAYTMGDDKYPRNLEQSLSLLNNFKPMETRHLVNSRAASSSGVAPTTPATSPPDTEAEGVQCLQGAETSKSKSTGTTASEGTIMAQAKAEEADTKKGDSGCYHCGDPSHWIMQCPELTEAKKGQLFLQLDGAIVSQVASDLPPIRTGGLRSNFLYLDTCTTNDQVVNWKYLTGLHTAETPLKLHTNAGTSVSKKQGYLGSHLFWLDPQGIANVVSLKTLEAKHRVSYNSDANGGAFIVHTDEGDIEFKRCPETGFPYIDLDDSDGHAAMLVQSVRGNYEGYTKREIQRAREARELQGKIGHPSDAELKRLLDKQQTVSQSILNDCPITKTDVTNSVAIFGPSVPRLKGTAVRQKPVRMEPNYIPIPLELLERNRQIVLLADIMFIGGLPFLISLSRRIRFVTVQYLPDRAGGTIADGIRNIHNLYKRAGYNIQCLCADSEFEVVAPVFSHLFECNTTAKNEHVGEIERKIRHIKERVRCVLHTLPYKRHRLPSAILRAMVYHVTMWANAFVSPQGISDIYSPRELVLRRQLSWKLHARAHFGSYCEVFDDPPPGATNSMNERTVACINLGPIGNFQGTHRFFNLVTGRIIKRRSFRELPMPAHIIDKVKFWGSKDSTDLSELDDPTFQRESLDLFQDDVAPYPDIPDDLPGILPIASTPPPSPHPDDAFAVRAAEAAANANFDPNLFPAELVADRSDTQEQETRQEQQPHININVTMPLTNTVQDDRSVELDGTAFDHRSASDDRSDNQDEQSETDDSKLHNF